MAAYMWDTKVYPAEMFVESCGAILFDLSGSASPPSPSPTPSPASSALSDSDSGVDPTTTTSAAAATVNGNNTNSKKVCLLHYMAKDQWLLPKGRRNCRETRQAAAVREVREESGYACRLRPVTMPTRAPSVLEAADVKDFARTYPDLTEPFMLEVRDLGQGEGEGVKLVWWFVAEVLRPGMGRVNGNGDGDGDGDGGDGEDYEPGEPEVHFAPAFFECEVALKKLTFQKDREVLRRAMDLVETSKWDWSD
ncbi:NUDIX domain-containing protein [Apiospora hydei]|uniref:NUDIX domain-containing protein n=1 Tax=Apiospora hydei TaxID=1337664 RepID=A0ABR1VGP5_9PEZI